MLERSIFWSSTKEMEMANLIFKPTNLDLKPGYGMNDQLTETEWNVFADEAIEAGFQAWAALQTETINLRKLFLTRLQFLFQSGKLGRE
jgi:hypothetical protein